MGLLLALIGFCLLLAGLVGVWQGHWRIMWGAQAYMALYVIGCLTMGEWYQLAGISRGDGFVLIGFVIFGLIAAGVSLGTLAIAGIIHSVRGRKAAAVHNQGKSDAA